MVQLRGKHMHNLVSRNQLDQYSYFDINANNNESIMNDYFECIVECELDNNNCKTVCTEILKQ